MVTWGRQHIYVTVSNGTEWKIQVPCNAITDIRSLIRRIKGDDNKADSYKMLQYEQAPIAGDKGGIRKEGGRKDRENADRNEPPFFFQGSYLQPLCPTSYDR